MYPVAVKVTNKYKPSQLIIVALFCTYFSKILAPDLRIKLKLLLGINKTKNTKSTNDTEALKAKFIQIFTEELERRK